MEHLFLPINYPFLYTVKQIIRKGAMMKRFRCLLGFHDFYALYPPLILLVRKSTNMETAESMSHQYVTIKRICIFCKKREEYMVKLSGKLEQWDVETIEAPKP